MEPSSRERVAPDLPWILVHGFPLDRRMWSPLIELGFPSSGRAIDLPGFGGRPSLLYPEQTRLSDFVEEIVQVADELGAPRFGLAGLSMGGYVAFECWRRIPERIGALLLADTRPDADSPEGARARHAAIARVKEGDAEGLRGDLLGRLLAPGNYCRTELVAGIRRQMASVSPEGIIGALSAMVERPDSTPLLGTIDVPTLVVVGDQDAISPPEVAAEMAARIPGAQLAIVPHAGHMAPMENPARVMRAVARFLGAEA